VPIRKGMLGGCREHRLRGAKLGITIKRACLSVTEWKIYSGLKNYEYTGAEQTSSERGGKRGKSIKLGKDRKILKLF